MENKLCKKCGVLKSVDMFYKCKTCTDGLRGSCITCVSAQKADKYNTITDEERQRNRERNANWAKNNPSKIKEYRAKSENKQSAKDNKKLYYKNNKEKITKYKSEWHLKNRDKLLASFKEYRKTEMYKVSLRASAHNLRVKDGARLTSKILFEILFNQESKCKYCNKELDLLNKYSVHIDHRKPISKGGDNSVDNIAWCCALCNLKKGEQEW